MINNLPENEQKIWTELPSVSVIVLNFNTWEHLEACFNSLQQLLYPQDKLELIMVDNASTDTSVEYIKRNFPRMHVVQNNKNYGFCKGNNIGAQQAKGELIAFLNPDMRVDPRWLIEAVKLLMTERDVAAVSSKILNWDGTRIDFAGGTANFYGYGYQIGLGHEAIDAYNEVKPVLFACGGAMVIHRQIFLDTGGFDEDYFAYYEDVDLGWRLWVLGYRVLFAPTSITYHIHHGAWKKVSEEKRRVLYERNAFFTMLKNYDELNLAKILPAALLLMLKRIYLASGIDDELFRLGQPPQQPDTLPVNTRQSFEAHYNFTYYLKEAWNTLRKNGLLAFYHKVKAETERRQLAKTQAQIPDKMALATSDPQKVTIPLQALSYVTAGNDMIALLQTMKQKRETIQVERRRSDQEIFEVMGNPFGFSEPWPEYKKTQDYLIQLFEIDTIFNITQK